MINLTPRRVWLALWVIAISLVLIINWHLTLFWIARIIIVAIPIVFFFYMFLSGLENKWDPRNW